MDEKRTEEEARELTPEEINDMIFEEQIASGEHNEKVPEYYFSNPDPYAKVEPRPDDAPKRDIKFDENGDADKSLAFIKTVKDGQFQFLTTTSLEDTAE